MAIGSVFYIMSFKYVGAAVGSVLASTSPLFAVPMSLLFLKEHVSRIAVVGIAATIAGVFLVLTGF
jgi:drug/metabolite transporter (DMT)-like permease